MPASIDAFQAVAMAGGFLSSARRSEVLVLSRASGQSNVTEVDLSTRAMRAGFPNTAPLDRYDVVYVPRSGISQVGLFMQQYVRDALPVQFRLLLRPERRQPPLSVAPGARFVVHRFRLRRAALASRVEALCVRLL